MIIDAGGIRGELPRGERLENDTHAVWWEGLVFSGSAESGAPSIAQFLNDLQGGLAQAAANLRGIYFVAVHDKVKREFSAFVDQSALFHAFVSDRAIGTSFLELVADHGLAPSDFDKNAVADFISFGYVSFGRTLSSGVRKLNADEIACFSASSFSLLKKPICPLETAPACTLEQLVGQFSKAVARQQISLDLTGGIDSRLLAILLDYFGLDFEVALSGVPGNREIAYASAVAEVLGRELRISYHNGEDLTARLPELVTVCDGMFDLLKEHPALQMQHERMERGATLMVTGVGGELYKDFWWLQDFPFYSRRQPNLEKLYALRIVPISPDAGIFAEPYAECSRTYRHRAMQMLAPFVVQGNTQTYDRVYYGAMMREVGGRFSTNHVRMLDTYAPYLERDAVVFGYHLPRSKRFFNRFHRETATRLNARAAAMPTTEGGISCSAEPSRIALDVGRYARNKLFRLQQKLGQRFFRKPYALQSPVNPNLFAAARELPEIHLAIERLKESGILSPSVTPERLPNSALGPVLSLHATFDILDQCSSRQRIAAARLD